MKQVEIDNSLKDLNVPIISFKNEIITLNPGIYTPKSTVIRILAIEDCVICDVKNENLEIHIPQSTIEYFSIGKFKLKSGILNIVNL